MVEESENTIGVNILDGDAKVAVRKLSFPLIVSLVIGSLYYIVDAMWISGLGVDALTAIGFIIPLQFIILGIGAGLGSGITAVISKYIGMKNHKLANNASFHSLLLIIIFSVIITLLLLVFMEPLYILIGASGMNLQLALEFSRVFFVGSILLIFPQAMYGILRAEGDVKRTMYAMFLSTIINIILDPIFIYQLNMGIEGAAYATLISLLIVCLVIIYWIYIKKDTYLKPYRTYFKYDAGIIRDILKIGIPASIEFFVLSFVGIIMNLLLLMVSNSDYVAVYETGWRLISFAFEPLIGIGSALVSIVGFNYGAKRFNRINEAYNYAMFLGTIIGIISAVILYVFANQIAYLFAYSSTSSMLHEPFVVFLKYFSITFLTFPIGVVSTYLFQGFGKANVSLLLTFTREAVCAIIFSYLFAVVFNMGLNGVWLGNVVGYTIGAFIAFIIGKIYVSRLLKNN